MKYGEIRLPDRGGHEQRGLRPAIIWRDTTAFPHLPTVLVIPLTSKQDSLRFGAALLLQPTATNGLTTASVAMVFQMGASDVRRIENRLGEVDPQDLTRLQDLVRKFQKL